MAARYTMILSELEKERITDVFQRLVREQKTFSLIDSDLLTRVRAMVPDTARPDTKEE